VSHLPSSAGSRGDASITSTSAFLLRCLQIEWRGFAVKWTKIEGVNPPAAW